MNIYIEKEFLDSFSIDYDEEKASIIQKIVFDMFTKYPEATKFINYQIETAEEFEKLKKENYLISLMSAENKSPIPVKLLKDQLFRGNFSQDIVFTKYEKNWFKEAERRGALCFTFENYEAKIDELIKKLSFKIDLSEEFTSWNILPNGFPFNKLIIADGYILTDKSNQRMDENIIPLLQNLLKGKEEDKVTIEFYVKAEKQTKELNERDLTQKITSVRKMLKDYQIEFKVINNSYYACNTYDFHDRTIINSFQLIECGKGFNLFPFKKSNSQIISETIFDFYSYKRIKNLKKMHSDYFEALKNVGDNPNYFKYIKKN